VTDRVRIGTRGSQLALRQAEEVAAGLRRAWPGLHVELVPIRTSGDRLATANLAEVGGKGLFVKEIDDALRENRVDLAVHSLKDLPAERP
jgi:hydroxymethylbilane synthase